MIPSRNNRVVNNSSAARVGGAVGVRVRVEVALGLGVIVDVGGWVFVGVCVIETVLLGKAVQAGVGDSVRN